MRTTVNHAIGGQGWDPHGLGGMKEKKIKFNFIRPVLVINNGRVEDFTVSGKISLQQSGIEYRTAIPRSSGPLLVIVTITYFDPSPSLLRPRLFTALMKLIGNRVF